MNLQQLQGKILLSFKKAGKSSCEKNLFKLNILEKIGCSRLKITVGVSKIFILDGKILDGKVY